YAPERRRRQRSTSPDRPGTAEDDPAYVAKAGCSGTQRAPGKAARAEDRGWVPRTLLAAKKQMALAIVARAKWVGDQWPPEGRGGRRSLIEVQRTRASRSSLFAALHYAGENCSKCLSSVRVRIAIATGQTMAPAAPGTGNVGGVFGCRRPRCRE